MHLPALLGMLMVGLVLRNAAPSSVAGLPASWSSLLRTSALGVIFMRSGVELDLQVRRGSRRVLPACMFFISACLHGARAGAVQLPPSNPHTRAISLLSWFLLWLAKAAHHASSHATPHAPGVPACGWCCSAPAAHPWAHRGCGGRSAS